MRVFCKLAVFVAVAAFAGGGAAFAQEHAAEGAKAAEHGGHIDDPGHGNATTAMEDVSAITGDLSIYTFVVFLVLLAILMKAAWPKISDALLEREKRIEGHIADAAAKHEEAKRLLAEHEAKLASAAADARALLEEARRDAEATKTEIVAEARTAAKQENERAKRDIDQALDAAMKHLAESSADVAVQLAGKVIRETINPAKQQELVREALTKLAAATPSKN